MEKIYTELGLLPAELLTLKRKLNNEENEYAYSFFTTTLSKWHGTQGSEATVEAFVQKLECISGLEPCIGNKNNNTYIAFKSILILFM